MLALFAAVVAAAGVLQSDQVPFHLYVLSDAYDLIDSRVETTPAGPVVHLVYRELNVSLDVVEGSPAAVVLPRIPLPSVTSTIDGADATYGTEYAYFRHYGAIVWRPDDLVVAITSQDEASAPLLVNAVLALR